MRPVVLPLIALGLTACAGGVNPAGMLQYPPWQALTTADPDTRRGEVELFVKTNHAALVAEIGAGGGPLLSRAMDLAAIPEADRPARLIQLRADRPIHAESPAALVTALLVYGG